MEKENASNLVPSLSSVLNSADVPESIKELLEIGLDSILNEGLAKDIPVLNTITTAGKVILSVRDHIFIRKVAGFLKGLQEVLGEQRGDFLDKIEKDRKHRQYVGETLVMLLDKYDNLEKPELLAKLFAAYLKDGITYGEFMRYATSVDRAFIQDLKDLLRLYSGEHINSESIWLRLYPAGFSNLRVKTTYGGSVTVYLSNDDAVKFAQAILQDGFRKPNEIL
ncbi:MAG: hypothetical protein HZC38_21605 [Chloroflexi bacterium]|nr:hypothetical protein [Chloroflexota bacterium]MBI5716002.1 hypothetical protein [Chloroflexota bacterium]